MLFDISAFDSYLKQILSPARYRHSLGVMQVMEELAGVYALDRETAAAAGLLHDAAKDLPLAQQKSIQQEAGIKLEYPCEGNYALYLHGPVGAYLVAKELQVTEACVLDGISRHTFFGSGEPFLSPLIWCLRFADILEPYRDWDVRCFRDGRVRLWKTVFDGRLGEGAFLHTGWLLRMFGEKDYPIHPNMTRTLQELSMQFGLDEQFLELNP